MAHQDYSLDGAIRGPHTAGRGRRTMTTQQQMTMHRSRLNRRPVLLALVGVGIVAQPFFAENVANGSLAPSVSAAKQFCSKLFFQCLICSVIAGCVSKAPRPLCEKLKCSATTRNTLRREF